MLELVIENRSADEELMQKKIKIRNNYVKNLDKILILESDNAKFSPFFYLTP